jgi:hypothetical protein
LIQHETSIAKPRPPALLPAWGCDTCFKLLRFFNFAPAHRPVINRRITFCHQDLRAADLKIDRFHITARNIHRIDVASRESKSPEARNATPLYHVGR